MQPTDTAIFAANMSVAVNEVVVHNGVYISAGHNCWGILWAPVCGLAMAELVMHGHSSIIDLDPFTPSRYLTTTSISSSSLFMEEQLPSSSILQEEEEVETTKKEGKRGRKQGNNNVGEQW